MRNRSYKTDIVKIHAGTHCWLLERQKEFLLLAINAVVTNIVHLEPKLLHVPGITVAKIAV